MVSQISITYSKICLHCLQFEPVCCQMQWIQFQLLQMQTFHTVTVKTWTRVASKALVCDHYVSNIYAEYVLYAKYVKYSTLHLLRHVHCIHEWVLLAGVYLLLYCR